MNAAAPSVELAREFMENPIGRHSADLQLLLDRMRSVSDEAFHVLVTRIPGARWQLALMPYGGAPNPTLLPVEFDCLEAAERHVFAVRWEAMTGNKLDID